MNRQFLEGLLKIGLTTASGFIPGGAVLVSLTGQITQKVIEQIQSHNNGRSLDDLTQEEMEASVAAMVWKSPEDLEAEGLG